MLIHPNFDPVAISIPLPFIGPISVHWYGLMYLFGFAGAYLLATYRIKSATDSKFKSWTGEHISDLLFYSALGAIAGGRLGYILFYKAAYYIDNPLLILKVWEGGMSFHGGLIGVTVALFLFAKHKNKPALEVGDFVAPLAPIGLFFGRIGNFINQELWGKTTELPWGMVFTNGGPLPRHPSMLYEAFLEGLVLFVVLQFYAKKQPKAGRLIGAFLVGYALFRSLVEFVRVPDAHLDYMLFDTVTMGHLLSLPMFVIGFWLLFRTAK